MSDSEITVTAAQFAQMLKDKYPQHATVADDRLIHAFIEKNPQYRVTYEGITCVSVSWERPAPVLVLEQPAAAETSVVVVAHPSPAPIPTDEPVAPPTLAAPPATVPSPAATSTTKPVGAPATEEFTEMNWEVGMESNTRLAKPCIVCGVAITDAAKFCLECGVSQNPEKTAEPAHPSSVLDKKDEPLPAPATSTTDEIQSPAAEYTVSPAIIGADTQASGNPQSKKPAPTTGMNQSTEETVLVETSQVFWEAQPSSTRNGQRGLVAS